MYLLSFFLSVTAAKKGHFMCEKLYVKKKGSSYSGKLSQIPQWKAIHLYSLVQNKSIFMELCSIQCQALPDSEVTLDIWL